LVGSYSIQESLDSHLSPADTMRLKPVYLSRPYCSIRQAHATRTLQLSPSSLSESFDQQLSNSNALSDRDRFDVGNFINDFELHIALSGKT